MFIKKLLIENFRNLTRVDVEPHAGLNFLGGDNGAGKTSVIESLVVLSRGKSFRSSQAEELIGPGADHFRVFAELAGKGGRSTRLGLERAGKHWKARKDGVDVNQLSRLLKCLPLVLMEPNSHLLISGPPELRRKYLDWGMFHVEHGMLKTWRSYSKVIKQRNAALRHRQRDVLDGLDHLAADLGQRLGAQRQIHFKAVRKKVLKLLSELLQNDIDVELRYLDGWKGDSLLDALKNGRERDLEQGQTAYGPHRADVSIRARGSAARNFLSRGEQKTVAAAFLLAQAEILTESGQTPVILMDDLASEFDGAHYAAVLNRARGFGGQVWVTGTEDQPVGDDRKVFHVERGTLTEVV